jgi:hypothetical protein
MEAYGLVYDAQAVPRIPPASSVSMPIWDMNLPARVIEDEPRFIPSAPPVILADSIALLAEAGCPVGPYGDITCQPDSPLAAFGCEYIHPPAGVYSELGPQRTLVATCYTIPPDEDQARETYLFRRGCAFRRNAAHIFKVAGEYRLLDTPEALRAFFTPLESPEEALVYAQLATGLAAQFTFEYDPALLYFQESIAGTRVTESAEGYSINLFHFPGCFCEPWINSVATIQVGRSGEVAWQDADPISVTTGFSCAD